MRQGYCGWFGSELIGVWSHGVCTDRVIVRLVLAHEINRLPTQRVLRTRKHWTEVVAVRTERREVCTTKTKGNWTLRRLITGNCPILTLRTQ